MTDGATGLVPAAGVPLLRLLAEESGVRGHASTALRVPAFHPGHDRGQVLVDVAIGLAMGATSVSAAMDTTAAASVVTGAVASGVTAWRLFGDELDAALLDKLARARATHRRRMWTLLAARPEGFPDKDALRAALLALGVISQEDRLALGSPEPLLAGMLLAAAEDTADRFRYGVGKGNGNQHLIVQGYINYLGTPKPAAFHTARARRLYSDMEWVNPMSRRNGQR